MRLPPSSLSRTSILIALALVASACASGLDSGDETAALARQPALTALPHIQRMAYNSGNVAFVAGDLGVEMNDVAAVFSVSPDALELADARVDHLGMTRQRYSQTRDGLPVVGGDLLVVLDEGGVIRAAVGTAWSQDPVASDPSVAAGDARTLALEATAGASASSAADLVYVAPSSGGSPVLAWRSRITGTRADGVPIIDDVFIDAQSGAVVDRHPHVYTARNRTTYPSGIADPNGGLNSNDQPTRLEGDGPTGDTDVDLAHDAAGLTYDCLSELFMRDSYDDLGGELVSLAHVVQSDGNGNTQPMQNAFWNGQAMAYGDGFALIDVGNHELGHAVTQYTADLIYQNESGALNEAMSDIYSAICDGHANGVTQNTWDIGEDLNTGGLVGPLRFMNNPAMDGFSSDSYDGRFMTRLDQFNNDPTLDNGGVHIDSGIANLAFYLLTEGGTHPRQLSDQQVVGIGIENAGQIFYRAETTYYTNGTNFAAARTATEQAAGDLFGEGSDEQISVSEAWFAVGVGDAPPERTNSPDPDNGGTDPNNPDGNTDPTDPSGNLTGGCSVGGGSQSGGLVWLLGVLAVLPVVRRRRRR